MQSIAVIDYAPIPQEAIGKPSLPQLPRRNLLHLINRDRTIHIHRGLVRLVTKEVLDPFRSEAPRLQEPSDGMPKNMRVQMFQPRVRIADASPLPYLLYDVVGAPAANAGKFSVSKIS